MALDSAEPEPKRMKTSNKIEEKLDEYLKNMKSATWNLTPIVEEDLYKPIPVVQASVGIIRDPKDISKTILTLNDKVPMKELQHLKRAQKKEIVICPLSYLNGAKIEEYLENNVKELKEVFEEFKVCDVPSRPPQVRKQFEESNKVWPCNFHPNKYNEKLVSGSFYNEQELKTHRQYMEMVFEVTKFYMKGLTATNIDSDKILRNLNTCVVVDPSIQSVVAVCFDNRLKHPVQHSAMLAIDNVAKTQNGGSWVADREKHETIDSTLRGIDEELCCHLKEKFPQVKFGAKKFKSKRDMSEEELQGNDIGPYLCTGYYIYLLNEPCVMCSMGLVHARAKRVFFCFNNSEFGALKSKVKLQTITALNHHFEAFTGFL
ncbi:hypothetical protein JYU34_000984 [Plutella xylostella]|uniref:Inactive tRNA-specific adenosine deaminase-like protein 3 n=1 Tax=Plutella xylostella TaxID=51655 RepID=A0ABQ7R5V5_PLUXY|nr:hypothetical protein JYU34_000984 [Plutella xylostella]